MTAQSHAEAVTAKAKDPIWGTIAAYESKASEYIWNTRELEQSPNLHETIDEFIELFQGICVLDVGFGSGRDSIYLQKNGISVVAIELTQAFINSFLKLGTDIPVCKMDMRHLAFTNQIFDGIWCCATFLHLPYSDALNTLVEFNRVLRQDGILYIDVKEGKGNQWESDPEGNVSLAERYYTYYSEPEIIQMVKHAGFKILFTRKQENIRTNQPSWISVIGKKAHHVSL